MTEFDAIVGLNVKYLDYLGMASYAKIVYAQLDERLEEGDCWLYLEDVVETDYNDKVIVLQNGQEIKYADIRKASEVSLDD